MSSYVSLQPYTADKQAAAILGKELEIWLPKLPRIYVEASNLCASFPGNAAQKNIAYRRDLHKKWKFAAASNDYATQMDLADTYIRKWGGLVANKLSTIGKYTSASSGELIAMGSKGIASWSKLLAIRDPRRFPIYDARVAFSMNAIQAMKFGNIRHWFHIPNTRITWISDEAKRLKLLSMAGAEIPDDQTYQFYLNWLTAMGLGHRQQRCEMLLFAAAPNIARQISSLPPGPLNGASYLGLLPAVRHALKV